MTRNNIGNSCCKYGYRGMLTLESKQIIMFLLGKEMGELVCRFSAKKITKAEYDEQTKILHSAGLEVTK